MPRVQREMHLRERETSWRREALRLAKLFAMQGVNTSGEQRCVCQDSDAVKKTELRDCRSLLSERRLNGSDELFPRHIFSSALQPLHQYHRVHKTFEAHEARRFTGEYFARYFR